MIELKELNINEVLNDKTLHKMIKQNSDVSYDGDEIEVDNSFIKTINFEDTITFDRLREAYSEYYDAVDYFLSSSFESEKEIDANGKPKADESDVLVVHPKSIFEPLSDWNQSATEIQPLLEVYKKYGNELEYLENIGVEMDNFEGVSPQQQLEKNIEEQWYKWTDEHGLYDDNTSFNIDSEGDVELWVDTINHTTLSLYDNDSDFLNFRDIVNDHDNLNESVIAESFINAVNDFDPDDTFNELWSPEFGERSSLKPSEFIKMLTEDKDYYEEKALELNDEYGLSMDIDGPSKEI